MRAPLFYNTCRNGVRMLRTNFYKWNLIDFISLATQATQSWECSLRMCMCRHILAKSDTCFAHFDISLGVRCFYLVLCVIACFYDFFKTSPPLVSAPDPNQPQCGILLISHVEKEVAGSDLRWGWFGSGAVLVWG